MDEPLAGVKVPEGGVEAKAGKTSAKDRARKNVTLSFKFVASFKFERVALLENSSKVVDTKPRLLPTFFGQKTALSFALRK
jgi:hypothetical protein